MISYYAYPGLKFSLMSHKQMHSLERGKTGHSPQKILEAVCEFYNQPVEKVLSKSRKRELAWCRQVFCYLSRAYTSMTMVQIGDFVGGKDHTTVIHSENLVKNILDSEPERIKEIREIEYLFLFQATVGNK